MGTMGRDRAALLRADWMGRKEPLPVRTRVDPVTPKPQSCRHLVTASGGH